MSERPFKGFLLYLCVQKIFKNLKKHNLVDKRNDTQDLRATVGLIKVKVSFNVYALRVRRYYVLCGNGARP